MKNGDQPVFPDPGRGAESTMINQSPLDLPQGMTKREAFALAAMQGLMAFHGAFTSTPDILAEAAVRRADALLKALES